MTDNNNPKKNITGAYPGVTGSYKSPKPDVNVPPKPISDTHEFGDIKKTEPESQELFETVVMPSVNSTPKSEQVKKELEKPKAKDGFDFKAWFSQDNVKRFLVQFRFYGIIVAVSLLLTFGIVSVGNDVFAFIKPDQTLVVNVPQGASTMSVAKTLESAGVIEHPLVFRLYSKLIKKADGTFQYGDYSLNSNLGYDQIISALKKPSVQAETVTFTIEPGWTQDDIVSMLTSKKYFDITELNHALNEYEYKDFPFVSQLPKRRCRLEGYLIAGDYEMSVGESAVSVVSKILSKFNETVLTEANTALITNSGYTVDRIVTIASLLQKECGGAEMYKGAASVIVNRLNASQPLCLTSPINYVLSKPKTVLTADDKRTDSEYNTYLHQGLPKGPVCNPSADAVFAALSPDSTQNLYFVCDESGIYYSQTAEAHEQNLTKTSPTRKGTDTIR